MLEMGTSGLMSGEGKPPAACWFRSSALPRLYRCPRVRNYGWGGRRFSPRTPLELL